MKKVIALLSTIAVLLVAGIVTLCCWPAIKGTIDKSKYYTYEQMQEEVNKSTDETNKRNEELLKQIEYYKGINDEYYSSILSYQKQIKDYETQTENNQKVIDNFNEQKTNLQTQVNNLQTIKTNNEETISGLNTQISSLQNQVLILTNSGENKREQISQLNTQISSLQTLVYQLQNTNEMNVDTITSLNSQISSLNSQISDMTILNQNSSSQISVLNNKIIELQKSIAYYESYIAQLENGEQVVATFEYDGSVYNIQIVNKGSMLSIVSPESSDYKVFNGWKVNGESIDLDTYTISQNTKIVADITYKFDIKFMVDEDLFDSQIVIKNGNITLPTNPTKDCYEFDGWSLNGVDIVDNISEIEVNENITYQAVFTKLHNVQFIYEDEIVSTQLVRNGNYSQNVDVENKDSGTFNGWKVNDVFIDVSNYKIFSDTIFVADITYVDWIQVDYNDLVQYGNSVGILDNKIFYGNYEFDKETKTWKDIDWVSPVAIYGSGLWTDGVNYYYSSQTKHYVYNKEISTWVEKTWNGLTSFWGSYVWSDGNNTFYTKGGSSYILNIDTSTWSFFRFNGYSPFDGNCIWSIGNVIYYSRGVNQYILNKETSTWEKKTWNGLTTFDGICVWTDGVHIYYSPADKDDWMLDLETSTWVKKIWNGLETNDIVGSSIWTDGVDYYFSNKSKQYKLVK